MSESTSQAEMPYRVLGSTGEEVSTIGVGGWLMTPKQLPCVYRTWKHMLFELRKETTELLFQHIMQVCDLGRYTTKSLRRNGAFVIANVWLY